MHLQDFGEITIKADSRNQQRVVFPVVTEIVHNLVGFQNVAPTNGILQFEHIVVLRDAYVLFHVSIIDFL